MNPDRLKTLFPKASEDFINANHSIQPAESEPAAGDALGRPDKGKEESKRRVALRYRIFRVRPQDTDNSYGSTKQITDALVLSGLIQGDDPTQITTIVEQEKVAHFTQERVEIKITWPN